VPPVWVVAAAGAAALASSSEAHAATFDIQTQGRLQTHLWSADSLGASTTLPAIPSGGSQGGTPGVVPKRIFTYWHDRTDIPDLVAGCMARMKHYNPSWEVYMLYPGVPNLEPPPQKMANACCGGFDDKTHIADWYRAAALAKFGGVWIDSTSIVNQPLENWVNMDLDAMQGWQWVGSSNALENWAFVAPYKSLFMSTWMAEMRAAWQMGPELYCANINPAVTITDALRQWLPYLTMHAAFVVTWTRLPQEKVRYVAGSSMDAGQPFAFLQATDWKPDKALHRIFFEMTEAQIANTTLFKLRGDERKAANSLASYAGQGSKLAQEMLALITTGNATNATNATATAP